MDPRIGEVINSKYKLIRVLGEGGMGTVYEATHEGLGTRVAIKVLHTELARRTGLVDRFLQEARVAAQIKSPHVVQVVDIDRTGNGHAFIVMELLDGEPLSTILDRQHRLSITNACEYTSQILEALEAAHAIGVVHRDLKPENVFVTFLGGKPVLKLIDFGIAKIRRDDPAYKNLTIAGVVMGTAEYMAPEQARSAAEVDARSDIYAVGVMLYEMLAGSRPVPGDDARIIALKVERGEVVPLVQVMPEVPRELAGLVHRAMAARPELRFTSAAEMRLSLGAATNKRAAGAGGTGQMPHVALPAAAETSKDLDQSATGTLKGAPADAVIAAAATRQQKAVAAMTPPHQEEQAPHTVRAPQPAPVVVPPAPRYDYSPRRTGGRSGGMGVKLLILAIPVVIGGGILIAVAASGSRGKPQPLDTGGGQAADNPTSAGTATTAGGTTPVDTTLRPLDPGNTRPPTPHPTGGPGVPSSLPSSVPSGAPPANAVDAGGPSTAPSTLPSFFNDAGAFTLPSSLPSTLPPIPSTLPFPFQLPGQPPPPTPQPSTAPGPTPPHPLPSPSAPGF